VVKEIVGTLEKTMKNHPAGKIGVERVLEDLGFSQIFQDSDGVVEVWKKEEEEEITVVLFSDYGVIHTEEIREIFPF